MSYKNQVINNDRSISVNVNAGAVGGTVIRAPKGGLEPKFFGVGEEQNLLNYFGTPSSSYPDVWDLIQYNRVAPVWACAPSKNGTYSGAWIKQSGSEAFSSGLSSTSGLSFSAIPVRRVIGTGNGSTTNFTYDLTSQDVDDQPNYVNQSIDVELAGTSLALVPTDAAAEDLSSVSEIDTGTYTRATGIIDLTFANAPADGEEIAITYDIDISDEAYFGLAARNPQADELAIKATYDATNGYFLIYLYTTDGTTYSEVVNSPYRVSLTAGAKDGFGRSIYIEDVFRYSDWVRPIVNTALAYTTLTDDTTQVDFAGGSRGDADISTEYATAYAQFYDKNTYPVDIFFDPTGDSNIPTIFETLRTTYQKYSSYILPTQEDTAANTISDPDTAKSSVSNAGVYFYWNSFRVTDIYNNSSLVTYAIGRIAAKHAQMVDVFNGLAPSWFDENNHGGQLGSGFLEATYSITETQKQQLDDARINAVTIDPQYGPMILSQRTSLITDVDASYIAHSRLFDFIKKSFVESVLVYQITKLNDTFHRSQARTKGKLVMEPLLAAPLNLIRDYEVKCDGSNNNDAVLARREFVLELAFRVTPFAERIKFYFTNLDQTTSVAEYFG